MEPLLGSPRDSTTLPEHLLNVLIDLHQNPYPFVPNPPNCKKRASVALILRVRPSYNHWPQSSLPKPDKSQSVEKQLENFFSQDWVKNGDPEVLFIKRASRVGDRWTGHVALPGGKRDPEDVDDKAAAIRETSEEVGLSLTADDCVYVGNLPERVVTTSWGGVPLMVLCPYIFLTTRSGSPPLKLQPAEVSATHWVSLRALLSPGSRAVEYVDVSDRFLKQAGPLFRIACRSIIGQMEFPAIQLRPTESLQCSATPGFIPSDDEIRSDFSWFQRLKAPCLNSKTNSADASRPLLLWGLTLGVMADFLDMLPPHTAVALWKYPTFTPPDLRFIVTILTHRIRKHNTLEAKSGVRFNQTAMDSQTAALPVTNETERTHNHCDVGIGGLGVGRYHRTSPKDSDRGFYVVGILLKGYYERLRVAIGIYLAWRAAAGSVAAFYIWKLFQLRRTV